MSTDAERYDVVVVGAGQAGPSVAVHFAHEGRKVALVERDRIGGTCLNVGCRPTKALRASARRAHLARNSAEHGVRVREVVVDVEQAMARKDEMIARWRDGFGRYLDTIEGLELVHGHGRFTGTGPRGHRLDVDGRALEAELVVLDVGARPRVPDIPGLRASGPLTSDTILSLKSVPRHLLVLGGSYIGLELAQIFHRFGSRVTVLERAPRLAPREDPDVSQELEAALVAEGVRVHTGVNVERVDRVDGAVVVSLVGGRFVEGSDVLVALGRQPNTDALNLERVGLQADDRGYLRTDDVFRTAAPGIVALGDINGRGAFTHTAYQDGEIFIDHARGGLRTAADRIPTYAMFTDPPLGRVGLTEREARASGRRVEVARQSMATLTKAVLDGETYGVLKLLVDADTRRFIGAACIGPFGDEVIQIVSALMHADAPYDVLARMLPIHPTVAEFLPTILSSLRPLDDEIVSETVADHA